MDILKLRQDVIKKYFSKMNDRQFEAVTTTEGPLLILAGAGSGKTTVLVNRIANIVRFGNSYNSLNFKEPLQSEVDNALDYISSKTDNLSNDVFCDQKINPWNILAITFTNKAAGELKERICAKLGEIGNDVWAGTFHSICGRILRKHAELLGYTSHFTIYDTDDQRRLMKDIMKRNNIDDKFVSHKTVLAAISNAKDQLISPEEFVLTVASDFRQKTVAQLYQLYQKHLKTADAMDFDDMILKTVELLQNNPEVLKYYTNRFRYVMVDEYQDTNHAQYILVSLLASGSNNLCVVGDDDQSIYRFRGATIENILNFEDDFKNAKTIRLEQNYRSTSNILNAANNVISNNTGRKGKTLWTDNGDGDKIELYTASDERDEARYVSDIILENVNNGGKFCDNAILYRMNAQSNAIENVFMRTGIPYKVVGGMKFFDRKEIKDIIAYLHLINNNNDDVRLKRIINEPKRGIGNTTLNHASDIASSLGVSIYEVISHAEDYPIIARSQAKLKEFCSLIDKLTLLVDSISLSELFDKVIELSGYYDSLVSEGEEAQDRLNNVKEFSSNIAQYELETDLPSLSDFLEQLSLVSDIDLLEEESDKAILMTIHSAKGLEFDNVFLIGMEEGIFPGNQSIYAGKEEIEEERRLAYVAITRAKKQLTVTNSYIRMLFGSTTRNLPSRFIQEIPSEFCINRGSNYNKHFSASVDCFDSFEKDIERRQYQHTTPINNFADKSAFVNSSVKKQETQTSTTYSVGMQINHKTFGVGLIISVIPAGNDTMLEIAFEKAGTKKIMANYAKLTIL